MLIAFFSALFCALTRGVLNVIDRAVLRRLEISFSVVVLYNNLFPTLVAFLFAFPAPGSFALVAEYFWKPGIILSALGAQLAAQCFFFSFRRMTVKNVALSAKAADLVLPLVTFLITSYIPTREYFFSVLSVIAFLPIALASFREKTLPRVHITVLLVAVLCFQCGVNSYFQMRQYADTWPKFLAMMACILSWRSIFTSIGMAKSIATVMKTNRKALLEPIRPLFGRAVLAFVSQAAFFYSITRVGSAIAWPVINSTPIISCCIAHFFLSEHVAKSERWAFVGLMTLSVSYLAVVH